MELRGTRTGRRGAGKALVGVLVAAGVALPGAPIAAAQTAAPPTMNLVAASSPNPPTFTCTTGGGIAVIDSTYRVETSEYDRPFPGASLPLRAVATFGPTSVGASSTITSLSGSFSLRSGDTAVTGVIGGFVPGADRNVSCGRAMTFGTRYRADITTPQGRVSERGCLFGYGQTGVASGSSVAFVREGTATECPAPTIAERLDALQAAGLLTGPQVQALLDRIAQITTRPDRGAVIAIRSQLESLVARISAAERSGRITAAQAEDARRALQELIARLG